MSGTSVGLDNAVVFLFAHQRLVFRYPLTNAFELVLPSTLSSSAAAAAHGGGAAPTSSSTGRDPGGNGIPESPAAVFGVDTPLGPVDRTGSSSLLLTVPGPAMGSTGAVSSSGCSGGGGGPGSAAASSRLPSCVGLEIPTLLFLLRNTFTRLTTLNIGSQDIPLFVYPLVGVEGEATLVMALKNSDDVYGHATRFAQVFCNLLLREEQRCGYASENIANMVVELDRVGNQTSTSTSTSSGRVNFAEVTPTLTTPGTAATTAAATLTTSAAATSHRRSRGSCVFTSSGSGLIDHHGHAHRSAASIPLTGIPTLDLFSRAAHSPGLFQELRLLSESVNGAFHEDIVINQLVTLPHSLLSGHMRHRRQVVASFSSRFDPGSVVVISDANFPSTRRRQYEQALGSSVAQLFPLEDVAMAIRSVPSPRTLFDVRASLEAALRDRIESATQVLAPPSAPSSSSAALGSNSNSNSTAVSFDAPFLVFEVIEFLRLFAAVTLDVQRIAITHGALSSQWKLNRHAVSSCVVGKTCSICRELMASIDAYPLLRATLHMGEGDCRPSTDSQCGGGGARQQQQSQLLPVWRPDHGSGGGTVSSSSASERVTGVTASGPPLLHQLVFDDYHRQYDDPWFFVTAVNDGQPNDYETASAAAVTYRSEKASILSNSSVNPNVGSSDPVTTTTSVTSPAAAADPPGTLRESETYYAIRYFASHYENKKNRTSGEGANDRSLLLRQAARDPQAYLLEATNSVDQVEGAQVSKYGEESGRVVASSLAPKDGLAVSQGAAEWLRRHCAQIRSRVEHVTQNLPIFCQAVSLHTERQPQMLALVAVLTAKRWYCITAADTAELAAIQRQRQSSSSSSVNSPLGVTASSSGGGGDGERSVFPTTELLIVVAHVMIAALWGVRGGVSFPKLCEDVEHFLRRFVPLLRNLAHVERRERAVAAARSAEKSAGSSGQASHYPVAVAPLTSVERELLYSRQLFGDLSLLPSIRTHQSSAACEVQRIPCRWLVHAAMQLVSDVVCVELHGYRLPSAAAM